MPVAGEGASLPFVRLAMQEEPMDENRHPERRIEDLSALHSAGFVPRDSTLCPPVLVLGLESKDRVLDLAEV